MVYIKILKIKIKKKKKKKLKKKKKKNPDLSVKYMDQYNSFIYLFL